MPFFVSNSAGCSSNLLRAILAAMHAIATVYSVRYYNDVEHPGFPGIIRVFYTVLTDIRVACFLCITYFLS